MKGMITALLGCLMCFNAAAQIGPGEIPPDALGHTRAGDAVTVSSLHGKVVVISFWATWCGYCMKEMPVLNNLQAAASARHLALQVVSINSQEDRRTFLHAARVLGRNLPGLLVTWDRTGELGKPYGADQHIPVMVMLHRDGRVAQVHVGYGPDMLDSLVAQINQLLAEPIPE